MSFEPRQSKANQIWIVTFIVVILVLAIETQPHEKNKTAGQDQANAGSNP